jgi:hypothetical protein
MTIKKFKTNLGSAGKIPHLNEMCFKWHASGLKCCSEHDTLEQYRSTQQCHNGTSLKQQQNWSKTERQKLHLSEF